MTHSTYSPLYSFLSLAGERLRAVQLSDHEMVITQDVISWNIMMQGRYNAEKQRYNNGFAITEDKHQYHARLKKIAAVLAEINSMNPYLRIITLQEAPVAAEDIAVFVAECLSYPSLNKFATSLKDSNLYGSWGVITLVDTQQYAYQNIPVIFSANSTSGLLGNTLQLANVYLSLENRIQVLLLQNIKHNQQRYIYNVHLPYDITKAHPEKMIPLLNKVLPKPQGQCLPYITLSGDFNCSLTKQAQLKYRAHYFAPKHNSIEFHSTPAENSSLESVDAIVTLGVANTREYPVANLKHTTLFRLFGGFAAVKLSKSAVKNAADEICAVMFKAKRLSIA